MLGCAKAHRARDMPVPCFYSGQRIFCFLLLLISLRCYFASVAHEFHTEIVGTFGTKQFEQIYYEIKKRKEYEYMLAGAVATIADGIGVAKNSVF